MSNLVAGASIVSIAPFPAQSSMPNSSLFGEHGFLEGAPAKALAPTQTGTPFLGAQVAVMVIFITLKFLASKRFPAKAAQAV